ASPSAIIPAGTLKLTGNGAMTGAAVSIGSTGQLLIDSTATGATRATTINVGNAGLLTVKGNDSNDTVDTITNLNVGSFQPGEATINIQPGAGHNATLAVTTINRDTEANSKVNGATVNIRGPHLGATSGTDVARLTFGAFGVTGSGLVGAASGVTG